MAASSAPAERAAPGERDASPGGHTSLSSSDLPSSPDDDFPGEDGAADEASPDAARDPRLLAAQTAQMMLNADAALAAASFPAALGEKSAEDSQGRERARDQLAEAGSRNLRRAAAEEAEILPLCTTGDCSAKRARSFSLAGESLFASAAAGFDSLLGSSTFLPLPKKEETQRHARADELLASAGTSVESSLRFRGSHAEGPNSAEGGGAAPETLSGENFPRAVDSLRPGLGAARQETASPEFPSRGPCREAITVRPFRSEDAEAVKRLCYRHFRSLTVHSVCFWVCHHSIDLLALFVIALLFIPFSRVLLAGVLFFVYLLLRGVWEFEMYIRRDCQDLNNIQQSYMKSKASGFWVAERLERDPQKPERVSRRLAGCIGLAPLQNDNKTAQLVRLVVDRSFRRQHIGSLLLNTFISYALQQHYSVVRLYTNNLNSDSIRFAKTKGFELQQVVRRGLMRGDLLKWQKKLEAPGVTQRKTRTFNLPSSVLD
ncbi:putative acetyltransferase domain-containing protein [Neospora caninum Liverpool]|uniref:Acetyltransferase domain-containing protein,putative n=1 Tax=Neospora caninum (strain Liverpool) TaxID=572307 RepID=F0VAS1_NEOCL|nr:putative acetyltransferase domain-containing protein [Neospora caninum Liverpool]CBZ51329.1 putative acetyltransferase domain-containing protein [Neospora caninum Liverpool]CEL68645.1 TPA: acetyltransferase domain-containing protein,putative [Neospora caninum Liverpool]|eukprot:XP_003881362.1 putative acetyltransferase domain-containing protein [Neospora caninum Liverpool]